MKKIGDDTRTIEQRLAYIKSAIRKGDIDDAAYEAQRLTEDVNHLN